jgi:hypothetical protein
LQPVPEESLILVGILPDQRDLEIARLLGWYRIPLKSAPKVVDVDFVAFYQTSAFGDEHRWKIEKFCPVRGHELVTRAELFRDEPDHPRANEEYFKISLGPIEQLSRPIVAGEWKRVTFLYTIGELFNKASTINQLVVRSEERQMLWQNLRERLNSKNSVENNDASTLMDDPSLMQAFLQWFDPPYNKKNNPYRNEHKGDEYENSN